MAAAATSPTTYGEPTPANWHRPSKRDNAEPPLKAARLQPAACRLPHGLAGWTERHAEDDWIALRTRGTGGASRSDAIPTTCRGAGSFGADRCPSACNPSRVFDTQRD